VEVICLAGTPDRHDGEWIRVRYHGFYVESSGIAVEGRHLSGETGVSVPRNGVKPRGRQLAGHRVAHLGDAGR
jgi:hypothetical protein